MWCAGVLVLCCVCRLPLCASPKVQAQRRSAEAVFMCDCLKELLPATRKWVGHRLGGGGTLREMVLSAPICPVHCSLLLSEDVLELSPVLALRYKWHSPAPHSPGLPGIQLCHSPVLWLPRPRVPVPRPRVPVPCPRAPVPRPQAAVPWR